MKVVNNFLAVFNHPGGMRALLPILYQLKNSGNLVFVITNKKNKPQLKGCTCPVVFIDKHISVLMAMSILKKKKITCLLSGTSEPDDVSGRIESIFVNASNRLDINSLSILDCWHKYKERYSISHLNRLDAVPKKICVMDSKAKKDMIKLGFHSSSLCATGNPYYDRLAKICKTMQKKQIADKVPDDLITILFISQPLSERNYSWLGYSEFTVVRDLIRAATRIFPRKKIVVKIKIHPSECLNKYDYIACEFEGVSIDILKDDNIYKFSFLSIIVVGMFSMLLFELFQLGVNVISYQPINDKRSLVHTGINSKPAGSIEELSNKMIGYKYTDSFIYRQKASSTHRVLDLIRKLQDVKI